MLSRVTVLLLMLLMTSPVLIFWAWLLILPTRVAFLCPEGCWCDPEGNTIDCFNSSLNNIPKISLKNVRELEFRHINLTYLRKDSFLASRMTQLETLRLDNCGIVRVEPEAFNGLIKLVLLSMTGNKMNEIEPRTFENLTNLERLYLINNKIENLELHAFVGLPNLSKIWLNTNKIQYLHPDSFLDALNLFSLHLDKNPMAKIPTDHQLINSQSLRNLHISNCNVSSVSAETFANVSGLETLDLSGNHLADIDVKIFAVLPQLSTFRIALNPLKCDCQLQQAWRWCQNRNITTDTGDKAPECDGPGEVKGMWWDVLKHSQCLQNQISYHGDYKTVRYKYTVADNKFKRYGRFKTHVQTLVYAILFVFGATGNVIILIIIVCNKEMHTVPNMYILNLAISDVMSLIINLPLTQARMMSGKWNYGEFLCKFFAFFRRVSIGLSAYSVALLSIQRYRVTVNPIQIHVHSPVTWRVTAATICGLWI
ncbi:chondroadherin-like, partial [Zootermopsis nevadensis]|uniref:chondroadherin-like n=1 Tax=Zootermopsis nevadensis TaxID=136037 RepID=UPI000B8ED811